MKYFSVSRIACLLIFIATNIVPSIAGCSGPMISLSESAGPSGGKVTVKGLVFVDGCHDVCSNGICPPTYPAKAVKLLFVQGNNKQVIARVDADKNFEISAIITIPTNAVLGEASILAEIPGYAQTGPVPFTVTSIDTNLGK